MKRQTANPVPVAERDRIGVLDALRAVALLGIFLVNIEWFTRPWQAFGEGIAPGLSGADAAAAWIVYVFFAGKFWILFSLLFGMGFAAMMARAEAVGTFGLLYLRRLAVLFAIGIAHALLQWVGDILHTYAIAGLLLFALRGIGARAQLATGLALYFGPCALLLLAALAMALDGFGAGGQTPEAVAESARAAEAAAMVYAGGGFAEVTAQRVRDFSVFVIFSLGVLPMVLGMFLVGSWLLRSGRMREVSAHRGFFVRLAAVCLPLGLGLTLWGAWLGTSFPEGMDDARSLFAGTLPTLGALPLSLGYLALLVLAWQTATGARMLGALAPAGRMALSNYLLQSLIGSLVFYGYGLAMWGRIGHVGLVLLVLAVFALQVLASRWWMARFRFGPMEWLWRRLTYGRMPPMRPPACDA